jgi:hypothetical protein
MPMRVAGLVVAVIAVAGAMVVVSVWRSTGTASRPDAVSTTSTSVPAGAPAPSPAALPGTPVIPPSGEPARPAPPPAAVATPAEPGSSDRAVPVDSPGVALPKPALEQALQQIVTTHPALRQRVRELAESRAREQDPEVEASAELFRRVLQPALGESLKGAIEQFGEGSKR